jgi:hypothetical protein
MGRARSTTKNASPHHAPRPNDWIDTRAAIADNVRAAMAAPIEHQDRWPCFVTLCRQQLNRDVSHPNS